MIIACIAVRLKSQRCPRKALADLYHEPLILRLVERLRDAQRIDEIVVCTSEHPQDRELADLAEERGIALAVGGAENVYERFMAAADWFGADHIVRVTGDNPLTDPNLIDKMIEHHLEKGSDYTYCRDVPRGTKSEIIRTDALESLYERDPDKAQGSEYMTYHLMELKNKHEYKTGLNREDVRLTVDYPEDLEKVKAVYEEFHGKPPLIEGLIEWYDQIQ